MNKKTRLLLTIILMIISLLYFILTIEYEKICLVKYEMSNGDICSTQFDRWGTVTMRSCESGNVYINPEYYKRVRVCE